MITVSTREDFLKEAKEMIPKESTVAEIGVLHGDFSKLVLDIIAPKYLVLIDPFVTDNENVYNSGHPTSYSTEEDYVWVLAKFYKEIKSGNVLVLKQFSYEAIKYYSDHFFNMIYIDASHLYEDVKRDLNDWVPKLKSGGVISGHDYIDISDFGVVQAVNEFCAEHNFEMIIFNSNGGDFALRKK